MTTDDYLRRLEEAHVVLHFMPDTGPDTPTTTVALSERDFVLIGMALPALEILIGNCIHDVSLDLQNRMLELVKVQQPSWVVDADEGEDE